MTTIFAESDNAEDVQALDVPDDATADAVADAARRAGLARDGEDVVVYLEDDDEPLAADAAIPSGEGPCRVLVGPRARIDVTVHYNGRHVGRAFSPATTIGRVRRWAARQLDISETEAVRAALQFCDTTVQPPIRRHLGALDRNRDRRLCFDFVPKKRIQGHGSSAITAAPR